MSLKDRLAGGSSTGPAETADAAPAEGVPAKRGGSKFKPAKAKSKAKPKKRNEMLASVLPQSVKEAALGEMRACDKFTVERNGATFYVGWFLNVEDIGGLSKKTNRDEQKGSIIECIKSGHIQVLITSAMLEEEKMVLIPSESTLEMAQDFSLLENAPYTTIYVGENGHPIDLDGTVSVSLADAIAVNSGSKTIMELLAEKGCSWAQGSVDAIDAAVADVKGAFVPPAQPTESLPPVGDAPLFNPEDIPMPPGMESPASETAFETASLADVAGVQLDSSGIDEVFEISLGEPEANREEISRKAQRSSFRREEPRDDDNDEDETDEDEEVVVSQVEFKRNLDHTLYSKELQLEINFDAFDAQFSTFNDFEPFNDNRPDGWLSEYLNQMSRDANAELSAIHTRNIEILRERYTRMMHQVADEIRKALSVDENAHTSYRDAMLGLDAIRSADMQALDGDIARKRKEIQDEYEEKKEQFAEARRREALAQFDADHSRRRENDMNRVEGALKRQVEAEYKKNLGELTAERREDAARRMDYGQAKIMERLASQYAKMHESELALYERRRDEIAAYLEDNRANDVAYANAVAEEHRQQEKADAVRAEFDERMRQFQVDAEQRAAASETAMREMIAKHEAELAELTNNANARMQDLRDENERLRERERDLLDRYARVKEDTAADYNQRMVEMDDRRRSSEARYDDLLNTSKRTNIVWVALAIVFALLAMCLGIIIGWHATVDYVQSTSSAILPIIDVPGFSA